MNAQQLITNTKLVSKLSADQAERPPIRTG